MVSEGGTMGMWGFFLRLAGYIVQQTNIPLLIAILAVLMIDGVPVVSDLFIWEVARCFTA